MGLWGVRSRPRRAVPLVPPPGTAERGRYEQLVFCVMAELDAQAIWRGERPSPPRSARNRLLRPTPPPHPPPPCPTLGILSQLPATLAPDTHIGAEAVPELWVGKQTSGGQPHFSGFGVLWGGVFGFATAVQNRQMWRTKNTGGTRFGETYLHYCRVLSRLAAFPVPGVPSVPLPVQVPFGSSLNSDPAEARGPRKVLRLLPGGGELRAAAVLHHG